MVAWKDFGDAYNILARVGQDVSAGLAVAVHCVHLGETLPLFLSPSAEFSSDHSHSP